MKKIFIALSACLIGSLANNNAKAQATDFADLSATMNLVDVIDITANPGGGGTSATFDEISEYTNGIENLTAVSLTVKSTQQYNITYKATNTYFASGLYTIPVSKLLISPGGANNYVALSTADGNLYSAQPATASAAYSVDYKFNPGFGYTAATGYTVDVRYTATQTP